MGHDVGSPFKGAAVDGCGKGVVHDEGYAIAVGNVCKLLDVEYRTTGIGDCFTEKGLGVGAEGTLYFLLVGLGVDESTLDAEFLHGHAEEVECATVDFCGGHNVVAGPTDVEHGIEVGCLSAAREHGTDSTFELRYLESYGIIGGILQAGVEVAFFLQVEEHGHFFTIVILECGALDDGHLNRFPVFRLVATLYAERSRFQLLCHILSVVIVEYLIAKVDIFT